MPELKDILFPSSGDPEIAHGRFGDSSGETRLNKEGLLLLNGAAQTDDLTFASFSKKTFFTGGKVDYDWDRVCIKMQKNGDFTNNANHLTGAEHYFHKFRTSKSLLDLVPLEFHFHWLQFNNTDQYETGFKYRIINNGGSYNDTEWKDFTVKTCDGHDALPFSLDSGKTYMENITSIVTENVFITLSAQIQVKFARIDSEDFSNDLLLVQLDAHALKDALGSVHPYQKYE